MRVYEEYGYLLGLDISATFCKLQAFPATVSFFDGGVLSFWDNQVCTLSGVILRRKLPYPIQRNQKNQCGPYG